MNNATPRYLSPEVLTVIYVASRSLASCLINVISLDSGQELRNYLL